MGCRGNIVITQDSGKAPLYFYTHWEGYKIKQVLQDALKRGKGRWGDDPYLARIIFCEMIQNDVLNKTGFGISTFECDNDGENPIVYVSIPDQTVKVAGVINTFAEFCDLKFTDGG